MNSKRLIATLLAAALILLPAMAFPGNLQRKPPVKLDGYRFWLYLPDDYGEPQPLEDPDSDDAQPDNDDKTGHEATAERHETPQWPLVIFLHGASLCGHNLERVLSYGTLDAIGMGRDVPAVVIAPQNPGGAWSPRKLNNILDWAFRHCDIDTTRVYVLGMSLGGYGTLDFAGTYPDRIAAAMALCGGCTLKDQSGLLKLPLWIMHGTADRAVPLSQSTSVVNKMSEAGPIDRLRSDWLPGASHSALARIFYLAETYEWLFAHRLTDQGRPVNRDIVINQAKMGAAYKDLPSRGRKWNRQAKAGPSRHKARHVSKHKGTKSAKKNKKQSKRRRRR